VRLSVVQIAGGALAALTAAIAASFLGVAGTVIGAAVMSVATTVGTDIYTHYLRRTRAKVKQHTPTGRRQRPTRPEAAEQTAGAPATMPHAPRGRLGWLSLGVAAALVFTISFGGILIYQVLAGHTVADQVNGTTGRKAEPGKRHGPTERRAEPAMRRQQPRSAAPTPSGSPSASPSPTPSATGAQATPTPDLSSGTASVTPAPTGSPPTTAGPEQPTATPTTVATSEQPPPSALPSPAAEPAWR
jgi:cytoskeletal protein RodZ